MNLRRQPRKNYSEAALARSPVRRAPVRKRRGGRTPTRKGSHRCGCTTAARWASPGVPAGHAFDAAPAVVRGANQCGGSPYRRSA